MSAFGPRAIGVVALLALVAAGPAWAQGADADAAWKDLKVNVFGDKPIEGVEIIGVNLDSPGHPSVAAWVDSHGMNTEILVSRSAADSSTDGFSVLGYWLADPKDTESESWGWRTEIEATDADHVTITAYVIQPDGQESRATLTTYNRVSL